jgi:hypothetical protein
VRRYVSWIPTPPDIQTIVLNSLNQEYKTGESAAVSWMSRVTRSRFLVPAFAGGAIASAFFLVAGNPLVGSLRLTDHTAENDIIRQSFETFELLRAGRIVPAMISSVPESVGGFFQRSSLQFAVQMPNIRGSDWYGGSASDNRGVKQAHVIYRMGDEWVYVCETGSRDAMSNPRLSLPPAAKNAIARSKWYTDPMHPNCNVVVWRKGGVVSVAVSTMGKDQLLALLTTSKDLP